MIKINIEQGSEAWHLARLGRVTGTRFKELMADKSTKTYKDLITEIAAEIITQESEETYHNEIMERGKELEPEAKEAYSLQINSEVINIGFVIPDEENPFHEWVGVSPDGFVRDGMVEIKCPLRKTHLNYIEAGKLPSEYFWQVQGQLFVTGLKWCDFVSFYPGMKLFIETVYPDEIAHSQITERLFETIPLIKQKIEMYNNY